MSSLKDWAGPGLTFYSPTDRLRSLVHRAMVHCPDDLRDAIADALADLDDASKPCSYCGARPNYWGCGCPTCNEFRK